MVRVPAGVYTSMQMICSAWISSHYTMLLLAFMLYRGAAKVQVRLPAHSSLRNMLLITNYNSDIHVIIDIIRWRPAACLDHQAQWAPCIDLGLPLLL